jgi:pyruvate formate lyase activating enzyme
MKIAGLAKQSLIDFPGRIAAVVFTQGCNFRCGYCHNPTLVFPELFSRNQLIPVEEVLAYLNSRTSWLEGVVITGGEPTIHNDLPDLLKEIKKLGYQIKLDTNGSNPQMLDELLVKRLIDFVAMDIKTLPDPVKYQEITGNSDPNLIHDVTQSIRIIKESSIDYQFRTTVIPDHHSEEIMNSLASMFDPQHYIIQQYRNFTNEYRHPE